MYQKSSSSWYKHLDFTIADIIMLEAAFILAYMIRHSGSNPFRSPIYVNMSFLLILIDLLAVLVNRSYKDILKRGNYIELKRVVKHVTVIIFISFGYMFMSQLSIEFSRIVFVYTWALGVVFLYAERMILKLIVRNRLIHKVDKRSILLVTTPEDADELVGHIKVINYRDYIVKRVFLIDAHDDSLDEIRGIPVLPNEEQALEYANHHVVDEIFVMVNEQHDFPEQLMEGFQEMGITTHLAMMRAGKMSGNQSIGKFAGYTVLTSSFRMVEPNQLLCKRLMDILGGIVGLMCTGIICIFIAPIIKVQSPGPIFFSQERVGRNGRKFKIYKFRSMYIDAEERKQELMEQNEMDGFMFKIKDDPRIFPFGKVIRKLSLDEFPQFWNVLKGDMSLVGTRPPTVDEYKQYDSHHKKRLTMKPGITGMWQVSGRSDITDFEEIVKLDTEYISSWNMAMDLKIIWKTVCVVLGRKGSA